MMNEIRAVFFPNVICFSDVIFFSLWLTVWIKNVGDFEARNFRLSTKFDTSLNP